MNKRTPAIIVEEPPIHNRYVMTARDSAPTEESLETESLTQAIRPSGTLPRDHLVSFDVDIECAKCLDIRVHSLLTAIRVG